MGSEALETFNEELLQLYEAMNIHDGCDSMQKVVKHAFVLPPRKLDQLASFFGANSKVWQMTQCRG